MIARHDRLTVLPTVDCTNGRKYFRRTVDLVFHASASRTPVNATYTARTPLNLDCEKESRSLEGRELGKGELLVVLDTPVDDQYVADTLPQFDRRCRRFREGFACTKKWKLLDKENLGTGFQPVSMNWPN